MPTRTGGTQGTVRILIAEDHVVLAQALGTMLGFEDAFEVVGTVSSGEEAVGACVAQKPDVVLMDYQLVGLNGVEATKEILQKVPTAKVLILSMYDNQEIVAAAVAAGAAGFLPKNVDSGELKGAIHAVAQGKGFLHPDVTMPFLERIGALARADSKERLTDREQGVLQELAQGKTTREIAGALVVSEETVKTHLAHIYQKLGVNDRVQAVALALRRGLVR